MDIGKVAMVTVCGRAQGEDDWSGDVEENIGEDAGKEVKEDIEGAPERDIEEDNGEGESAPGTAGPGMKIHNMGACQTLQSYLEEIAWLLQEIYQVGSATVQDSTLGALRRAEKQGAGYGMATLADWLRQLGDQLTQSRHRLRDQTSEIMDVFCRLWRYVQLCRQRTAYDMAGLMYRGI